MNDNSLIGIHARIAELEAEIVALGGELPPGSDLEREWDNTQNALIQKVDAYAEYVLGLRARAEALRVAAKKVIERADAMDRHADRMLGWAGSFMDESGELCGEAFRLKRRKNPPSVVLTEEWRAKLSCPEAITYGEPLEPGTYQLVLGENGGTDVVPIRLDKRKLAEALKAGQHIDGAMLHQTSRVVIV